jgi:alkanesulfonate monooxygenase SsuD/methylene tetrahydromethanopterin reductase-like flavin-dependent oxidoreductase (luciferase family)
MTMKLGLAIGYSGAHLDVPVALVQRAEELGYDSVWSAEAYGSDAITPLAFLAAKTSYVGGMGHRTKNFHNDVMVRRGFGDAAQRIQELYLAGHKDEAIAAVPDEWVDLKSLVGPPARIRDRYRAWEDSGADALSVRSHQPEAIELMAKIAGLN